jgi:hypothetical protein
MNIVKIENNRQEVKIDWRQWHTSTDEYDCMDGIDYDCPVCGAVAGQCCSDDNGIEWSTREHKERLTNHETPVGNSTE